MTKLSIDDVARAAGVHRSTVSRAFSRPEAVKAATREHVLRVAEELGYTMSPVARALRHGTTPLVPLVVPDVINPFYAELAESMTQAAGERGYQLLLCITDGSDVRTAEYLTAVHSLYAPFGVIAPSTRVNFERLRQFGFGDRVVVIDRVAEGSEVPSVTVDSRRGIELAGCPPTWSWRGRPWSSWTADQTLPRVGAPWPTTWRCLSAPPRSSPPTT
jgi:LacI family transcriptional regulator